MESVEEIILALRAAGWDAPEYEILPDGSYHFFHGNKETHSLITVSYTHLTLPTILRV